MREDPTLSDGRFAVRLRKADLTRTDQGDFLLPLALEVPGETVDGCLTLDVNDAARLHAQLTRHLSKGWALTEAEKTSRQFGEIYPTNGDIRLT